MFSRSDLALIKGRAMRRRVWFKVLDRIERAIINLTIKCVERVRSNNLARIVATIVDKLTYALKSMLERLMAKVGIPIAQKLSQIALNWGNTSGAKWAKEKGFVQYLIIMHVNAPAMLRF